MSKFAFEKQIFNYTPEIMINRLYIFNAPDGIAIVIIRASS
jgi:hypothetical protein